MQWLWDLNQSNIDNLNNVWHKASRHFRNNRKEYLKYKIHELETNSKIKNIRDLFRGISDFKKGYQPRINRVKDGKGDLVTDSHSILARCRNHFSQLFDVQCDVRQSEIHTAEPLVPGPSAFKVEMAIGNIIWPKSPGIDQIPAELIKAGGRIITLRLTHLLILFGTRRNCLRSCNSQRVNITMNWSTINYGLTKNV